MQALARPSATTAGEVRPLTSRVSGLQPVNVPPQGAATVVAAVAVLDESTASAVSATHACPTCHLTHPPAVADGPCVATVLIECQRFSRVADPTQVRNEVNLTSRLDSILCDISDVHCRDKCRHTKRAVCLSCCRVSCLGPPWILHVNSEPRQGRLLGGVNEDEAPDPKRRKVVASTAAEAAAAAATAIMAQRIQQFEVNPRVRTRDQCLCLGDCALSWLIVLLTRPCN